MRQLTHAEKKQLEGKIKDERKRQQALRERNLNISSTSTEIEFKLLKHLWNYGFLGFILWFLVRCVMRLLEWQDFTYDRYGPLVIGLMLLFNHITYSFTETGWKRLVMKAVARVWIVIGLVYIFWVAA